MYYRGIQIKWQTKGLIVLMNVLENLSKFCCDIVFFLYLWQDKPLWAELKTNGGVVFVIILLHFHYFISLNTANTQKSEVFLLRISLGNVDA